MIHIPEYFVSKYTKYFLKPNFLVEYHVLIEILYKSFFLTFKKWRTLWKNKLEQTQFLLLFSIGLS